MTTNTSNQGLPVPESSDNVNVPGDFMSLAQAIERKLVMSFTSAGDRSSKVAAPTEGMMSYLQDSRKFDFYTDGAWRTFFTGGAPGSDIAYGHTSSYASTPPADARHGHVTLDRNSGKMYVKSSTGPWILVGTASLGTFTNQDHNLGVIRVSPGNYGTCATWNFQTTHPNTTVMIHGIAKYVLNGVGKFLTEFGGFQDVLTLLFVNLDGQPPTQIMRLDNRHMNTGGTGSSLIGGPTPQTTSIFCPYTAATAGVYGAILSIYVGNNGGNGTVDVAGGALFVQPYLNTTIF